VVKGRRFSHDTRESCDEVDLDGDGDSDGEGNCKVKIEVGICRVET
jgi:hypothetical protein